MPADGGAGAEPVGLRERHKADKLERIAAASIAQFSRHGYEGTTLRDIARAADVALSTLSIYARDKRDLVLLIFNRVIPPLIEAGRRRAGPPAALTDNLVGFFEPAYAAYAANITLFRVVLAQVYSGAPSDHARGNDGIQVQMMEHLEGLMRAAMAAGACVPGLDVGAHATAVFYLHFAAVRSWIFTDAPDAAEGVAVLRCLYEAHAGGMLARQ